MLHLSGFNLIGAHQLLQRRHENVKLGLLALDEPGVEIVKRFRCRIATLEQVEELTGLFTLLNLHRLHDQDSDQTHNKAEEVRPDVHRLVVEFEDGADCGAPGVVADAVATQDMLVV